MFIDDKLKSVPDNKEQLLGWVIIRNIPYHLIGIYSSKVDLPLYFQTPVIT